MHLVGSLKAFWIVLNHIYSLIARKMGVFVVQIKFELTLCSLWTSTGSILEHNCLMIHLQAEVVLEVSDHFLYHK